MSSEQNQAAVRRLFQCIETGDANGIQEVIAPNWVNHDPSLPPMQGLEGARQLATMFLTAFPDAHAPIDTMIVEGDRVGAHFSFTGTHQGTFLGLPPTGKKISIVGAGIFRVVDGKLTDNWVNFDAFGLMQQLGLVPTPGTGS